MRILFVTDAKMIGGSEVYLREMLPRLRERGILAESALPNHPGNQAIADGLLAKGVPLHRYNELSQVPKDFDLVLASAWQPSSYRKFEQHFGPVIPLIHDQIDIFYPSIFHKAYELGYRILQAPNLRRAPAVITVSRWAARFLQEVHGVPRVESVTNGIDTVRFKPVDATSREQLRAKLGWQGFVVFVPARLSPEKNHYVVLKAAKSLPDVKFYIAGKGELEKIWHTLASWMNLPNVEFMGRREDMPELYQAADVVIQPTLGENQSLATLEAMCSGVPIITTDIPAQREIVEHQKTGLLVKADPRDVIAAIQWVQQNAEAVATMTRAARAFVLEKHTLEQCAENLEKTLRKLVNQKAGSA